MPTAPPVPTGRPDANDVSLASADVRSSRFYLLSRGHLAALLRRSLSVLALVTLDVLGLALGIYAALVLRSFAYGKPVYWSLLWRRGRTSGSGSSRPCSSSSSGRPACTRRASGERASAASSPPSSCSRSSCSRSASARATTSDDRADPDRGRHLRAHDRPPPRRLRLALAGGDASRGRAASRRARGRGREPPAAAARARRLAGRDRVRLRRRGRAGGRAGTPVLGGSLDEIPAILERCGPTS